MDEIRDWLEIREQHPQHVHSHWFRCQVCNEPFSEHDAGRVLPNGEAICGDCVGKKKVNTKE